MNIFQAFNFITALHSHMPFIESLNQRLKKNYGLESGHNLLKKLTPIHMKSAVHRENLQ